MLCAWINIPAFWDFQVSPILDTVICLRHLLSFLQGGCLAQVTMSVFTFAYTMEAKWDPQGPSQNLVNVALIGSPEQRSKVGILISAGITTRVQVQILH